MTQCYEGVLLQSSIVFLLLLLNVSHIILVRRKLDKKVQERRLNLKWYGHVMLRDEYYVGRRVMGMEVQGRGGGEEEERRIHEKMVGQCYRWYPRCLGKVYDRGTWRRMHIIIHRPGIKLKSGTKKKRRNKNFVFLTAGANTANYSWNGWHLVIIHLNDFSVHFINCTPCSTITIFFYIQVIVL